MGHATAYQPTVHRGMFRQQRRKERPRGRQPHRTVHTSHHRSPSHRRRSQNPDFRCYDSGVQHLPIATGHRRCSGRWCGTVRSDDLRRSPPHHRRSQKRQRHSVVVAAAPRPNDPSGRPAPVYDRHATPIQRQRQRKSPTTPSSDLLDGRRSHLRARVLPPEFRPGGKRRAPGGL